jgi:hypothetical protein
MLRLKRLGIDTCHETVAFLSRSCPLYRAEEFVALARIEIWGAGRRIVATLICGTAPEASAFSKRWRNGNGAVICSASHEGFSVKSRVRVQVGALLLQAFRCKPHIRQDDVPPLSFIRTKELQAGGTTLFERRLSAKPNNGAAPLNL